MYVRYMRKLQRSTTIVELQCYYTSDMSDREVCTYFHTRLRVDDFFFYFVFGSHIPGSGPLRYDFKESRDQSFSNY